MAAPSYTTVGHSSEIELLIHRSRFIGRCFPVQTEEEALALLERIRKQHWDATHNCYAYAVGDRAEIARYSDDGEPGGTAGLPMMEVFKRRGLTYALVVATRYFGGVLLGAGGLVRAYSKTTAEAVDAAGLRRMQWTARFPLAVEYPLWGKVESWLRAKGIPAEAVTYAENVRLLAVVPPEAEGGFAKALTELTDGRVLAGTPAYSWYGWDTNG